MMRSPILQMATLRLRDVEERDDTVSDKPSVKPR